MARYPQHKKLCCGNVFIMYHHEHCQSNVILLHAIFYFTAPPSTHPAMIIQSTCERPTLSLCVQIKPQQMIGYQT